MLAAVVIMREKFNYWKQRDFTCAPREGSDIRDRRDRERMDISIHAPREGSDRTDRTQKRRGIISIHTPREGSDP